MSNQTNEPQLPSEPQPANEPQPAAEPQPTNEPKPATEPLPVATALPAPPETEAAATTALVLEIILGFFSLLGIGHVYSGRTLLGILLMIAWWVYIVVASFLSVITLGFGACIFVPIYIVVPIISGIQARAYTLKTGAKGHGGAAVLVAGGGCLLAIILIVVLVALGVFAGLVAAYRSR